MKNSMLFMLVLLCTFSACQKDEMLIDQEVKFQFETTNDDNSDNDSGDDSDDDSDEDTVTENFYETVFDTEVYSDRGLHFHADIFKNGELVTPLRYSAVELSDFELYCIAGHFTELDSFSLGLNFGSLNIEFHREGGPCNGDLDVENYFNHFNDVSNLSIANLGGLIFWDRFEEFQSIDTVTIGFYQVLSLFNEFEILHAETSNPYNADQYYIKNVSYRLPIFILE